MRVEALSLTIKIMNRKAAGVVVIMAVLVASGVFYLLSTDDTEQAVDQMREEKAASQQSTNNTEKIPAASGAGQYVDYSEGVVAETNGTKLLFFYAAWCPQCRALEADIESQGVPEGVTIIKVDYDTHQDLRQKYEVTLQTTVVRIDDEGNLIEKYVAYDDPTLQAVKNNLL